MVAATFAKIGADVSAATREIFVFGAGSQAKVTCDAVVKQGEYDVRAFVVDRPADLPYDRLWDRPIYGLEELVSGSSGLRQFVAAVGDNAIRRQKTEQLRKLGFVPVTIRHPASRIGGGGRIGAGVVICAGATIDPDVEIEDGAIVNGNASVGHETRLRAYCHVSGGAVIGGYCEVGELTLVGLGAVILSNIQVGRRALVGAGSLVTKHVPDDMTALGVPARLRSRIPPAPHDGRSDDRLPVSSHD
jgi:sugar O-acyltransferase (sialic acid O-acetyltransferase NeuD family)